MGVTQLPRTIKSITFFSFSDNDAMAHLRLLGPAKHLNVRVNHGVKNGIVQVDQVNEGDIIVVQRDFPREYEKFEAVVSLAKANRKPIVYDLDDLLLELPENHPDKQRKFFASALLPMVEAIMEADLVTVSSQRLKNYLTSLNRNIEVLPNFFDDSIWKFKQPFIKSDQEKLTIGYMGGHTHTYDLKLILPAILKVIEFYPSKVEFVIWGIKPPAELLAYPQVSWFIPDTLNYLDFADYFQKQNADIFIAPLEDNEFNKCKSHIKFLEYSSIGAPGVYSNLEPYSSIVDHGINGLLAANQDEWFNNLKFLIENPGQREKLAVNAQEKIKSKWLMSQNAELWIEAYEKLKKVLPQKIDPNDQPTKIINSINHELDAFHRSNELELVEYNKKISILEQRTNQTNNLLEGATTQLREKEKENKNLNSMIAKEREQRRQQSILFAEKEKEILSLSAELSEIKISKAWRLALFFREVRVALIPPNSTRFKIIRSIYHYLKKRVSIGKKGINERTGIDSDLVLVSVVIPIYDRTIILIESIESILRQSYTNFELILVCDGSPAETVQIVKEYEAKDGRIRAFYFRNNSGNASRGRNKGIKEARGKYIAFQDSDDVAEVDRLKISLTAISQYDADVVYGGWRAIVDGTREVDLINGQEVYSPDCDLEMLKKICVPCQSTVMAKVESLRAVGGVNEKMRYREDHELWLRLAYHGYKFKSIDKILTNLRIHKDNLELALKDNDQYWYDQAIKEYSHPLLMKPKIGYIIPGTGISGGISVICEHVNRLLARGYDVSMITEDNNDCISWYPHQLVDVIPINKVSENYDILVATGWMTAYSINEIPAKRKFYFVQSDESRFYSRNDPAYEKARRTYEMDFEFLTEARWIQQWLKSSFGKNAIYVPNGINEKIIHRDEPIIPRGEKIRVLLEGPIDIPFKGMADAFEAVNNLDCEIWCVSSAGKPRDGWRCDQFFYKVPLDKMRLIYSSCDILLKMSRVEGFFGPPLEMMACGGTGVVSKVTGYDEYIVDGYNALVVEMGDIEGARAAVKRLIEDSELRNQLIANGCETVKNWQWDPTIDILEKVYRENTSPFSQEK